MFDWILCLLVFAAAVAFPLFIEYEKRKFLRKLEQRERESFEAMKEQFNNRKDESLWRNNVE